MATLDRFDTEDAKALIAPMADRPGAMLPILHALQSRYGAVPKESYSLIAQALNVSKADVVGVVTFYHDFKEAPFAGRTLKLCRAEACQAAGCEDLVEHLQRRHHIKPDAHEGPLRVETVYCLGNCALSPAALLDDIPHGRLDPQKLDALIVQAPA